jgi:hypothetical protein
VPRPDGFCITTDTLLAQSVIAMAETTGVVAANITNPISIPGPDSALVLQLATVVGAGLKGTVPLTSVAAIVNGYYTAGDGGGGTYYWDTASV